MKLKVRTTHTVTTDDLEMFCDPPLTFEAIGNIDPHTREGLRVWYQNKYPTEGALEFVPKMFLSVAQNGTSYPIATEEDAKALQEAVGDKFISHLVRAYWNYEAGYFEQKKTGSENLSAPPVTGNGSEPTP